MINRPALPLLLLAAVLLGACGGESSLPSATGKANINAINAIYASPNVAFLIEERVLGQIGYKGTSSGASYDDLDYTFNFDMVYAGDIRATRIASQHIDITADQNYTLLINGPLASPTVTVWESAIREFSDSNTVFQSRFAHTSNLLGPVDVYFALSGVAPALGAKVATLSFGEISAAMDFEAGDYAITITTSGDPADIIFASDVSTIVAGADLIITMLDGDANDTAPYVVHGLGVQGGVIGFHDPAYPPTVQFLHAATDMHAGIGTGLSDIHDDEALASPIVVDHGFHELTADFPVESGDYQLLYTPAGGTGLVSLETFPSFARGFHFRVTALGTDGSYSAINTLMSRRSIDSAAKLIYFQSTNNYDFTSLYVVDAGSSIEDKIPFRPLVPSKDANPAYQLTAGSYDVYVTEFGEEDILAGPYRLDVELGDVVDMTVFDTDDPAVQEIVVLSSNQ